MKRVVSVSLLLLLLISTLVVAYNAHSAKANTSPLGQTMQAGDPDWWPTFHHDLNRTGTSTSTGPTTNNIRWDYITGGNVYSSPAVVGGYVYVGSLDDYVYCLQATNGALVWRYRTGGGVRSSPAVAGGYVYVGSLDNKTYCLNAISGALVWSYKTAYNVVSGPAVAGGYVYVGSYDDYVYCLNATSGALVWRYKTGNLVAYSPPAVVGGYVYVGSTDHKVYCLKATTGASVWNYTTGGAVYSGPAVAGGHVYVGSYDNRTYCLNAISGALVWSYKTGSSVVSSPAVVNGMAYVGSNDDKIYGFGPQPPTVSISPTLVITDVNQSNLFTATVSGGLSPYSYQWYSNGVAVSGATSTQWTFTPTSSGSYSIYVNVTDGTLTSVKSNTASVTVNPTPLVTISPTSVTLDVGQNQTFTSVISGGTSPYSYQWYLDGSAVLGATNAAWTYTMPSSAGSHTVYLKITDVIGVVAFSNTVNVTVNGALSVTISPGSVTLDVGQNQTFTSTVSGGTSPYSYQWYLNNSAVSGATSNSWTLTRSSAGSHLVFLNVTDGVRAVAISNTATVTVNTALSVAILPSSVVLDASESQMFTAVVSGGTSSYSYQWYLNGGAVSGANSASWTFSPSSAGSDFIYVKVTDSATYPVTVTSGTVGVTVNAALSVTISPSTATLDVGQSRLLTANPVGGTIPFTYQWYLGSVPVQGATNATWTFIPVLPGTYTIYVVVTDSASAAQNVKSHTVPVIVNSAPIAAILPASVILDVGQSQTFTSGVSGGTLSYSYQWYLNGVPVSGATSSSWTLTAFASGSDVVYLNVTDGVGVIAISNTVTSTVNVPPSVSVSPNLASVDVGHPQTFTSTVSGGTSPCQFQWYLDGTSEGTNSTSWTYNFTSEGTHTVSLSVTDYVGALASSTTVVTVYGPFLVSVSPVSVVQGIFQSQVFTSSVSGGVSSYSYQWYLNDTLVPGATGISWTFSDSSPGYYTVYLNVTDGTGAQWKSNVANVLRTSVPWPTGCVVGITGYKLVFTGTYGDFFSSNATIDYYWSFSADEWNGTQWVVTGISGSSAPVVGYFVPALTTANLPYYVCVLNPSTVNWDEWLRIDYTFYWTYDGINYSTVYTAELNVHSGDIAGASVTFPYLGADGSVTGLDLHLLATCWLQTVPSGTNPTSVLARADIGGAGSVTGKDLHMLAIGWLKSWTNTPPPS